MLKRLGCSEARGEQREKRYRKTFQKYLPIKMGHIMQKMYQFMDKWEPYDPSISEEC